VGKLQDKSRRRSGWIVTGIVILFLTGFLIVFSLVKEDKTESWNTTASISKDGVLINEVIEMILE
tara:strand:+ start:287 stop:481 length:195 start_codon:yes stop_codon:yes gene_type:complete